MATYAVTIAGSTKQLQIGWTIEESANSLGKLTAAVKSLDASYRPSLDDDVVITENGTRIFGGLIDTLSEGGPAQGGQGGAQAKPAAAIITAFTAIDYNVYAQRIQYTGDRPSESLHDRMSAFATALSAQGVTLDSGQVTGPTLPAASYSDAAFIDVLSETMALANGTGSASWIWNIDYSKVLSAIDAGSVSAPINLADGDKNVAGDIVVTQARPSAYANYDVVLAGQGTQGVTDTFTGNGSQTTFALNYPLSISYGYLTVGGATETLGTSPADWSYDGTTNSITRVVGGAPGLGVAISITYVAQFPVRVVADGGVSASHRVTKTYTAANVFDVSIAQALANAYVTRDMDQPKTVGFNLIVTLTGWHPGQTFTFTSTARNLSGTHLVTAVKTVNINGNNVQRQVTAVTSSLLPATIREQFLQTFSNAGNVGSAAGAVTVITTAGITGTGLTGQLAVWSGASTLGGTSSPLNPAHGGTGIDTSAWSGIPTINAGAWTQNNVLTANRVLIAGSSNTVTSSSDLTFSAGTLTVNDAISTPAATNLFLNPTADLRTDPSSNLVAPTNSFQVSLGSLLQKYADIYAAELRVETLVAQQTITTIGGRVLVCTSNILAAASGSGTTLSFKYNDLANGDVIMFEGPDTSGSYGTEFMHVTSGPSGTGPYSYTVVRNYGGTSAAISWPAGATAMDTGQAGTGFIDLFAINALSNGGQHGPTIVGNVRNSATFNDWSVHWAVGNLHGIGTWGGYAYTTDNYGAIFGTAAGTWITIDTVNGVRIGNGSTVKLQLDASGAATFLAGHVTIADPNGINIAVPPNSPSDAYAYTFSSAFSGTNHMGLYAYESGPDRVLRLWNSTTASSDLTEVSLATANYELHLDDNQTGSGGSGLFLDAPVFRPQNDDTTDLGASGARWKTFYGDLILLTNPNDPGMIINMTNAASALTAIEFEKGGSVVGSITINSTNTQYNTSSDKRLKTNDAPTRYGLESLRQITVLDFEFVHDPDQHRRTGMFAQDLALIYPHAVTCINDRWMVDYGSLTPLLIQAAQEVDATVQDHERRIRALEGAHA